jgi:multidrug efflux pump subunit AcrA (membrane-fusion protein)
MIRKYVIPLLAIAGLAFALWTVVEGSKPVPVAPPVAEPAQTPFRFSVAGAGIVETSTQNIAVGTPISGVVSTVLVQVGDMVKAKEPLFSLDDRDLQAQLAVRQTTLQTARERLTRLQRLPRPEDIPPAAARVQEAEVALADTQNQLRLAESLTDKRAISEEERSRRRFAVQAAEAKLAAARAQLALLKAGSWKPDIDIAKAEIAAAAAQVRAAKTDIERLTIRAPVDGQILQVNLRSGEFAQSGVLQTPLILLGSINRLHVRVDVDEHDAWRIHPQAPAMAFVRGNRALQMPLQFVRLEPYIVPKRSLTGESTERVDTRVLQVIYSFERGALPVYVGQQLDVFIEAPPLEPAATITQGMPPGASQTEQRQL